MSDPTLSDVAAKALTELLQTVQSGKEFVLAQAPEVIQQMVLYNMITAWIGVAVGAAMLVLAATLAIRVKTNHENMGEAECGISLGLAICLPVFAIIPIGTCLSTAIMTTFAPKWFIVSELAKLIK